MSKASRGKSKFIAEQLAACDKCPKKDDSLRVARSKEAREANEQLCAECPFFQSIRQVSETITDESERTHEILSKGEDMSTEELIFLLEAGIHKKKIAKAVRMNPLEFKEMVNGLAKYAVEPIEMDGVC